MKPAPVVLDLADFTKHYIPIGLGLLVYLGEHLSFVNKYLNGRHKFFSTLKFDMSVNKV